MTNKFSSGFWNIPDYIMLSSRAAVLHNGHEANDECEETAYVVSPARIYDPRDEKQAIVS
jgi:hypothetical protein